jgi:heparan-alpha-glucosaminide N-acetyltransferase
MALPKRLLSIDVLRAVTMFLMIFVNDVGGVKHIPEWIDHAKRTDDAMGFADTIFPAFLFIVGLSLPFAINNRIKKGESTNQVLTYIFTRSAALLIMGFFHVNLENYNSAAAPLPVAVWGLVITIAFFLIWLDYPETMAKTTKNILRCFGVALLIAMAIVYKGGEDGVAEGMRPSWWGILGIIGWAYLVCSALYYFVKGKLGYLLIFWAVFVIINVIFHTGLKGRLPVIGDASSAMLVMSGIIISRLYAWLAEAGKTAKLWAIFGGIAVALLAAGFAIRPFAQGISKIRSTPAWILICAAITLFAFELFIYLVDMRGKKDLFSWIRPAGTSTLTCYLMPYFQVYLLKLFHINYPSVFNYGIMGIMRSLATSLILILLVGLMEKKRLRLTI